jgi:hypothetical protein
LWKRRKGYDDLVDNETWHSEYFDTNNGAWKVDTTRIYYKVSSQCDAFNMGALPNITL